MSKGISVGVAGFVLAVIVAALSASRASAGLLGNPSAYFDGAVTWSGSTHFDSDGTPNNDTLEGHVEWAVFAPGAFPYLGYTPTPGEFTYAYQIFVNDNGTGPTDPSVTRASVVLINPADNIGVFSSLPGTAPSTMSLTSSVSADWEFSAILAGTNSEGLAFSSPRTPMELLGSTIDHGTSALIIPLPSPSSNNIPEPGSLGVVALTLALFGRGMRMRPGCRRPA